MSRRKRDLKGDYCYGVHVRAPTHYPGDKYPSCFRHSGVCILFPGRRRIREEFTARIVRLFRSQGYLVGLLKSGTPEPHIARGARRYPLMAFCDPAYGVPSILEILPTRQLRHFVSRVRGSEAAAIVEKEIIRREMLRE